MRVQALIPTILLTLVTILKSSVSYGDLYFTLKGSLSDSNYLLVSQSNYAASGSVETDLGSYFRLGYTYRQVKGASEGYYETAEGSNKFVYRKIDSNESTSSIDLSIVLYYGEVFVPYVQVGVMKEKLVNVITEADGSQKRRNQRPEFKPSGGFGVGIKLNRNFSLKLSQTFSKGQKLDNPDSLEAEGKLNTYSSIGITYNI